MGDAAEGLIRCEHCGETIAPAGYWAGGERRYVHLPRNESDCNLRATPSAERITGATTPEPDGVLIPKDQTERDALAKLAGLTDEERHAVDAWCYQQATENARRQRRGLERLGETPMAATSPPEQPADERCGYPGCGMRQKNHPSTWHPFVPAPSVTDETAP